MIQPSPDKVFAAPWREELHGYSPLALRADLLAGLTVAIFAVPQAMAYAVLAGLPPVNGLYAAVVMSIVAALWGSSAWVNTGPTNSAALLTAAALLPFTTASAAGLPLPEKLALVFVFTLLVGAIRLVMGLLRLGWLVRFVPEPAFLGFTVAAGILIALGQTHHLLGVSKPDAPGFVSGMIQTLGRAGEMNPRALLIGLGTLGFMLAFDKWNKRFPVALGAIALATGAAWLLGPGGVQLVRDIALVPTGLPHFAAFPIDVTLLGALLPGAFAVAIIGLIEAVSIGQTLALKHRRELNFNQEFWGQGLSHIVGAFFGGFPGSGSFSRSVLIENSGAFTRLSNVFFGLFTALALLFLPGVLNAIPVAALSGLLLFVGLKLVDSTRIKRVLRTSKTDAAVMLVTFGVTLLVKIEWGFFAGIVAAMAFFLSKAGDLQLYELTPREGGVFEERAYTPTSRHEPSDVIVLTLHGDLFFGLAGSLRRQLEEIARLQSPQYIIVRTRRAHSIDYSCWSALFEFAGAFKSRGGKLILSGIRPDLKQTVSDSGMDAVLPPDQLVEWQGEPFAALWDAIHRVCGELEPDAQLSPSWAALFARMRQAERAPCGGMEAAAGMRLNPAAMSG